jgi:hypothetical protein
MLIIVGPLAPAIFALIYAIYVIGPEDRGTALKGG